MKNNSWSGLKNEATKSFEILVTLTHIHGFMQEYLNIQDVYYINLVLFCSVRTTFQLSKIPSCYFLTSCLYISMVGVSILRTSTGARQSLVTILWHVTALGDLCVRHHRNVYFHVKCSFCRIRDSVAICLRGKPVNYESRQEENK